jgi:endonuclease-3
VSVNVSPKRKAAATHDKSKLVEKILKIFEKDNPEPRCELFYLTPFQLLVSVVLSAQATDKSVNRCMKPLYEKGFTPEMVVSWGRDKLLMHIKSIGLAPTKSKNIVALAETLLTQHGGEVPLNRSALEALPGVGRKSANVVLGEIAREPTLAVDTHVFRVTARLGLHAETTPLKAEKALLPLFKEGDLPRAHHWFVLHGRYVCKAQKPDCERCPLKKLCCYYSVKQPQD